MKNLLFISLALLLLSCEKEAINSSKEDLLPSRTFSPRIIHQDTTVGPTVIITNDCISFLQTDFVKGCRFELANGQGTYPYDVAVEYLVETTNKVGTAFSYSYKIITTRPDTVGAFEEEIKTFSFYKSGEYALYDMGYVIIKAGDRVCDRELEFVQDNSYIVTIKSTTPSIPFSTTPIKFTVKRPVPTGGGFDGGFDEELPK